MPSSPPIFVFDARGYFAVDLLAPIEIHRFTIDLIRRLARFFAPGCLENEELACMGMVCQSKYISFFFSWETSGLVLVTSTIISLFRKCLVLDHI
jgi:hypothetical protein